MIVVDRKTKLTYEDYLQFPDDRRRHEIIDGNHYVSGAPFVPHQRILKKLLIQLPPKPTRKSSCSPSTPRRCAEAHVVG